MNYEQITMNNEPKNKAKTNPNKANLLRNQVCACFVIIKSYETDLNFWLKNPKANFRNSEMNVSPVKTTHYAPRTTHYEQKNKANQTQFIVSLSNLPVLSLAVLLSSFRGFWYDF